MRHSISPVFQNAAFHYLGLDIVYLPLEVKPENLPVAVQSLRAFSFVGVNVTIPHKKNIVALLDEVDEEVELLGVANTVLNKDDCLKGFITDGKGFLRSLREEGGFDPAGKKVLVFGAGGTAYALTASLIRAGTSTLVICNRTRERAEELKKHLKGNFPHCHLEVIGFDRRFDPGVYKEVTLIVNTTACGMKDEDGILVPPEVLPESVFVYDVIYNRQTELVQAALRKNLACLNGLSMLIYQGAVSFEIWTGLPAPIEVMKRSVLAQRKLL
ncbi:MAG: shikimate dehydrogenase [Candidatus Omnitrophica bacterium]|nr:shikimate dehydrogenase [Candidatus Omnitrophota bacterium]